MSVRNPPVAPLHPLTSYILPSTVFPCCYFISSTSILLFSPSLFPPSHHSPPTCFVHQVLRRPARCSLCEADKAWFGYRGSQWGRNETLLLGFKSLQQLLEGGWQTCWMGEELTCIMVSGPNSAPSETSWEHLFCQQLPGI